MKSLQSDRRGECDEIVTCAKPSDFIVFPSMKVSALFLTVMAWSIFSGFSTEVQDLESKAAQGDAAAQFELGGILLKGQSGVRKDPARALELMTSAAGQGHAEAMGAVGYFYANGIVVEKEEAKAVEWFRKGAENGGLKARLNYGKMLVEGRGIEKNEEEGRKAIQAAADQGQPDAAYAMGTICYFGEHGQSMDYPKAYFYFLKAAESGHVESQNMVGVMLESAQGVDMDSDQALEWYRKAAQQGHVKAQSSLGRLLGPEGEDPLKRVEALTWLLVASRKGEVTAQKMLEEIKAGVNQNEFTQAEKLAFELEKTLRKAQSK